MWLSLNNVSIIFISLITTRYKMKYMDNFQIISSNFE